MLLSRILCLVMFSLLLTSIRTQDDIFGKYYAECRKIAQAMTLEQKVGQTIQADFEVISNKEKQTTNPEEAVTLALGSLLISGSAAPTDNGNLAKIPTLEVQKEKAAYLKSTEANWKKFTDRFASLGVAVTTKDNSKYKIKFLLGTDAVHGDQHTLGNVLFPHNIGLSCSRNEGNFENVGFWTKQGVKRSGFNYVFSPTLAVSHNPQWGRFYESLGQDDSYVEKYGQSYIKGLQDVSNGKINGALGTAKHFFGDGSTLYGANAGNANVINFKSYIDHNIKGYVGAAKSNVGSVMISYNSINWIPNVINSQYLLGLLREDVKFNGFTISDYNDLNALQEMRLPRTLLNFTEEDSAYATMVNAGVDMFMLSNRATVDKLYKHAKRMVQRNQIPEIRLTEAVTRILTVKMAMGLVEKVQMKEEPIVEVQMKEGPMVEVEMKEEPVVKIQESMNYPLSSSGNQYQDSLTAVKQSLVLLKNSNVLPARNLLSSAVKYIILVGERIHNINRLTKVQLFRNFDNIGMQCGGWSVKWQGSEGNDYFSGDFKTKSNASSVLDAIKNIQKFTKAEILYPEYTNLNNEVIIDEERRKYIETLKTKRKDMNSKNTLIIGVFGEFPYAESVGDVNIPYCKIPDGEGCLYNPYENMYAPAEQKKTLDVEFSNFEADVVSTIKATDKSIPFVSVLLSGRPMIISDLYAQSDALIAAWLPGTSGGQGIIDAITGDYVIRPNQSTKNTLSMDWPKDMNSLNNFPLFGSDGTLPRINDPQFQIGFGLSTSANVNLAQE